MDDVSTYLESLPPQQSEAMTRIHRLITAAAPELDVRVWNYSGSIIGYGTYPYSTKAGPQGDWFAIGLAQRKRYISLYSMALDGERYLAESMIDRFPGSKVRKSCINITHVDRVSDEAVTELVEKTAEFFKDVLYTRKPT